MAVIQTDLHQPQFRSQAPASVRPELHPFRVISEDKDVALGNAGPAEFRQTNIHQLPADAATPMAFGHRQVMQVAAPAIVTAQQGANDSAVFLGHDAQPRIAPQICGNGTARVGLVQPHTLAAPPQLHDRAVIFDAESAHDYSIVAPAASGFPLHATVMFPAGFHGLG